MTLREFVGVLVFSGLLVEAGFYLVGVPFSVKATATSAVLSAATLFAIFGIKKEEP